MAGRRKACQSFPLATRPLFHVFLGFISVYDEARLVKDDFASAGKPLFVYAAQLRLVQANFPYVIWVFAFNTGFLFCYDVAICWLLPEGASATPELLKALNSNGMVVFLAVSEQC
jgi:hypothetical protein